MWGKLFGTFDLFRQFAVYQLVTVLAQLPFFAQQFIEINSKIPRNEFIEHTLNFVLN